MRKKKELTPVGRWHAFDREAYHWAWRDKKLLGVLRRLRLDLKYSKQRICQGYCDEDLFSIHDWFLDLMPTMLEQLKNTRHGSPGVLGENYTNEQGYVVNDTCHAEWDAILEQMVFLFRESNAETCQRKNPYEEEHMRIFSEFSEKYGFLGEKLQTPEELADNRGRTVHFPHELPEYQEAEERYMEEERKLEKYREECIDKAFELFSKWFYHLWD